MFFEAAGIQKRIEEAGMTAITSNAVLNTKLLAVSIGAVFMGANTYIGNAPNFLVKSIAEENGVKMPSFFGYMFWSILILVPCFIIINLIFCLASIWSSAGISSLSSSINSSAIFYF